MICVRQVKVHEVDRGTGKCSGRVLAGECSRASALRGRESARAYVEATGGERFVFTQHKPRLGHYKAIINATLFQSGFSNPVESVHVTLHTPDPKVKL